LVTTSCSTIIWLAFEDEPRVLAVGLEDRSARWSTPEWLGLSNLVGGLLLLEAHGRLASLTL